MFIYMPNFNLLNFKWLILICNFVNVFRQNSIKSSMCQFLAIICQKINISLIHPYSESLLNKVKLKFVLDTVDMLQVNQCQSCVPWCVAPSRALGSVM